MRLGGQLWIVRALCFGQDGNSTGILEEVDLGQGLIPLLGKRANQGRLANLPFPHDYQGLSCPRFLPFSERINCFSLKHMRCLVLLAYLPAKTAFSNQILPISVAFSNFCFSIEICRSRYCISTSDIRLPHVVQTQQQQSSSPAGDQQVACGAALQLSSHSSTRRRKRRRGS